MFQPSAVRKGLLQRLSENKQAGIRIRQVVLLRNPGFFSEKVAWVWH